MRSGVIAFAVAAAAMAPGAHAQLFKCKGPDGKIVYSDTRCDSRRKRPRRSARPRPRPW